MLLIDGSPGANALLLLAAQQVLPRFDAVLVPDTGWMLPRTRRQLDRLAGVATTDANIGMRWVRAQTSDTAREALEGVALPLPLHTLTVDGAQGRLPQGCARRQGVALSNTVRRLLGHPRPHPIPEGVVAECAIGTTLDHTGTPAPTGPPYIRFRRPLTTIGWTDADCVALLTYYGLPTALDMACLACPQRTNPAWRCVRDNDPQTFADAVAVDVTLRHGHPDPASYGRPSGTTFYLHPDRVPLDQADLESGTSTGTDRSGCAPWRRPGTPVPSTEQNGNGR